MESILNLNILAVAFINTSRILAIISHNIQLVEFRFYTYALDQL